VLPLLYPDAKTREALLADPQTAPIPALHRELFRFARKFVRGSCTTTPGDLERLRELGLCDRDIVLWATLGSTQSWFTMSADGGGVPLEGEALTGSGVGRRREDYEASPESQLAPPADAAASRPEVATKSASAWVDSDTSSAAMQAAASWAMDRYGLVPNLLTAASLQPSYLKRHCLALELLEAPQSTTLTPRRHAMVRLLVARLNRSRYLEATAAALLERVCGDRNMNERLRGELRDRDWEPADRATLALATKFTRNTYKVTEKDAASLREAGLDDEAYVDILNTVSIQTSLDRLANTLGVPPDSAALLAHS
jgi:uncharacterized peroxidase-related enzyme